MQVPDWKLREQVVARLEQALSPDSRVELDVRLPALDGSGLRQCDVLIRSGRPPRETLTIVEVQKRGKPVDVNTFDGWCVKMRSVGAQHLLCVSSHDFPKSIKTKARGLGPTVRLLTLKSLESPTGPNGSLWPTATLRTFRKIHTDTDVCIVGFGFSQEVEVGDRFDLQLSFKRDEKCFRRGPSEPTTSLDELVDAKLQAFDWYAASLGIQRVPVLSKADGDFWLVASSPPALVTFHSESTVEVTDINIPLNSMTYEQEGHRDNLGWVMTGQASVFGQSFHYRIVVVRDLRGNFVVSHPEIVGHELELRDIRITNNSQPFLEFKQAKPPDGADGR